jgi:hypothetical protein
MAPPRIYGYAVVDHNRDGTTTVQMYSALDRGLPRHVLAKSVSPPEAVHVEAEVPLLGEGAHRFTDRPVEMVTSVAGEVTLRLPTRARPA